MRASLSFLVGGLLLGACAAQPEWPRTAEDTLIDRHAADLRALVAPPAEARPRVLLLGVFHFADAGRDAHKPKHEFDIFSEKGQQQLEEVLARLAAFAPTKVLVEQDSHGQATLDQWYDSFRQGKHKPTANEIVTLGFTLAQRLGHQRVYGCDADGAPVASAPKTDEEFIATGKRLGLEWAFDDPVLRQYSAMQSQRDDIMETLTLRQRLRLLNHSDSLRLSHGAYFFFAGFRVSDGKEFPGPDAFASMWHNRNLRIFSNIQRLASDPGDRLLVIIGVGHVPILQQCVQTCPTIDWVPVDEYLGSN